MALNHKAGFCTYELKVIICGVCFIQFVFYSMQNPAVYRTAKKVVFANYLSCYVNLSQAPFCCSSLNGWTEYAGVITKFSGIDRFEKEINCKNRGRRSYKLSGLLRKAGIASRNIVMKEQYTLLWSALLWTSFVLDRQVSIFLYVWCSAAHASLARTLC